MRRWKWRTCSDDSMPLTKAEREQRVWLRGRRRARVRLVQALYAWESSGRSSLARSAQVMWDDLSLGPDERAFAEPLVRRLSDGMPAIDKQIAAVTTNWRMERIGAIERAILRLATAELLAPPSNEKEATPPLVILQESVLLAERFGSEEGARFVNGVLDALARKLGRL